MRIANLAVLGLFLFAGHAPAGSPIYIWLEPEWFVGVEGTFSYWTGTAKPTGAWGVAGPGVSPEWTQGGESEWNSIGVAAEETKAACHRDLVVPRTGRYKLWVRYVDHRKKSEPFSVTMRQRERPVIAGHLGASDVLPANDEYQLYWGFSFAWAAIEGDLAAGPARLGIGVGQSCVNVSGFCGFACRLRSDSHDWLAGDVRREHSNRGRRAHPHALGRPVDAKG
jgi:hypothetical protein